MRTPSSRTVDLLVVVPIVALAALLAAPPIVGGVGAPGRGPDPRAPGLAPAERPALALTASIAEPPTAVDAGSTRTLTGVVLGGEPPYTTYWSFGIGPVLYGTTVAWNFTGTSAVVTAVFEARDHVGTVAESSATIRVVPPPSITMVGTDPVGDAGAPLPFSVEVANGVPPFELRCSAPNGSASSVSTVPSDGTVGLAIVPPAAGAVWAVGTLTDADGRSDSAVLLVGRATPPPALLTTSVPFAEVGYPTSLPLAVSGGVPPFAWSTAPAPGVAAVDPSSGTVAVDGPLPVEATFDAPGQYTVPVTIVDASGVSASTNVSVNVSVGLTLGIVPSPASPDADAPLGLRIAIAGGLPPYAYRIALSDDETTSGNASAPGDLGWTATPVASGYLTVRGTVTDSAGRTANVSFTLWVAPASLPGAATAGASVASFAGLAAVGGAAATLVGTFALRRWIGSLRGRPKPGPGPGPGRTVVRELLAEGDDGLDRATLELLAEERHVSAPEVAEALAAWERAGRVRTEVGDDGREVVRWTAAPAPPASPSVRETAPGDP